MLKSAPITAFVATTAPGRAKKFYGKTLGLPLISEDEFALMFDAGGTMLRVVSVQVLHPAGYTVAGWTVPDIKRAVRDLGKRGVTFQHYDFLEQDEQRIWTAPSGSKIAWFHDPDGNTLSVAEHEPPKKRKARRA
jgi:catechol 2,3-dioxygenase-like lactoylglutathione lyase family enzyme